jgi:hypothetical protein
MSATENALEFGRETLEKVGLIGEILSQPLSLAEGFFDYFVEDDSKLYVFDKNNRSIIEIDDLATNNDYYVNGIMNATKDIEGYYKDENGNFINENTVVRYNPTSGLSGDLMESTLGKLLNWNSVTAQLGSMNRIVVDDLIQRQNIPNVDNKFHSQGTIIGTGAMNILNSQQIILNDTQTTRAVGPAVYQSTWENTAKQISNNVEYKHGDNDGVRKVTSPRTIIDPAVGMYNLITNIKAHNVSNYE